jgi:hypothetical protein
VHRDVSNRSGRRYLALGAVLALHVGIIAAIIDTTQFRPVLTSATRPLEITFLPPEAKPVVRPPSPVQDSNKIHNMPRSVPPPTPDLEVVQPAPSPTQSASTVDWAQEAQAVAATRAQEKSPKSGAGAEAPPLPNSPFAPSPAHHAGEEFTTVSGERAVYVSDNCYQVASPFTYSPNGINNGMGVQTYCNRPSHTPRGDLFDKIPAYKKYQPDQ